MRKVVIIGGIVLAVLGVIAGLAVGASVAVTRAMKPEPPLAGYRTATPAQAADVGRRIAAALTANEGKKFDDALDLEALLRLMIEDMRLSKVQQQQFIQGFKTGMAKGASPSFGASMCQGLQGGTVTLLRTRLDAGHERALLRVKPQTGVNYLELVIAVDPAGKPRIIDWYNYMTGELAHVSLRALAVPFLSEFRKSAFERIAESFANGGKPPARTDWSGYESAMKDVRGLMAAGKNAEALEAWRKLPEEIRATRVGQVLRLQCAQSLGDAEYQAAIDDMNAKFPNDPGLALAQLDGYFLKQDYAGSVGCIERVEKAIGGDAFLASLRATALAEMKKHDEAKAVITKAMADEPDLVDIWWTAVTVSLRAKDHAETARLLDEIEERFDIEMGDPALVPDYAEFAKSDEYRNWMRARAIRQAAADD